MRVLVLAHSREVAASLAADLTPPEQDALAAATPSEAFSLMAGGSAAGSPPDAALLEAESGGLLLCRELAQRHETLPVLLFSATRTDPLDRVVGFMLGADDYLVAPLDLEEVRWRIRRSLRRRVVQAVPAPLTPASPLQALSPRERDVLGLLLSGLSPRQVARHLVISEKTVGTHIQHILTKLDVHRRVDAISLALRLGFTRDVAEDRVGRLPWPDPTPHRRASRRSWRCSRRASRSSSRWASRALSPLPTSHSTSVGTRVPIMEQMGQ